MNFTQCLQLCSSQDAQISDFGAHGHLPFNCLLQKGLSMLVLQEPLWRCRVSCNVCCHAVSGLWHWAKWIIQCSSNKPSTSKDLPKRMSRRRTSDNQLVIENQPSPVMHQHLNSTVQKNRFQRRSVENSKHNWARNGKELDVTEEMENWKCSSRTE